MAFEKIRYVPIILVFLLNGMIVITFPMSWNSNHVTYLLPYISDTGAYPPESCIFSQVLNIVALLLAIVIYVRYRQLREITSRNKCHDWLKTINIVAHWLGHGASVGCSLVANFQETNLLSVHLPGALLTFGNGSIYMVLESILSYNTYPLHGTRTRNITKLFLALLVFLSFLIFSVTCCISLANFKGDDMTKWKKEDGYQIMHLISTVAEWICAIFVSSYIFLLSYDFADITISEPIIIHVGRFPVRTQLENRF